MNPRELKARTERFSNDIVAFCEPLLSSVKTVDIARQLLRSGTAVDSNYGSAQRARSHKEFTSKIGGVLDDASESLGWLTLLKTTRLVPATPLLIALHRESEELTKIFAKSHATARRKEEERKRRPKRNGPPTDRPTAPSDDRID